MESRTRSAPKTAEDTQGKTSHKGRSRSSSQQETQTQADTIEEIKDMMMADKDENDFIIDLPYVSDSVEAVLKAMKSKNITTRVTKDIPREKAQKIAVDILRTASTTLWELIEKRMTRFRPHGNKKVPTITKEGKPMHLLRVDEFLARVGIPLKSQQLQLSIDENLKETARFADTTEHGIRWLIENEPGHYQHSIQHQIPLIYSWERLHRQEEELGLMSTELGEITYGPLAITEIARDLNILTQSQFDILKWKSQVEKQISLPIFQEITRRVNGIDDLVWHEYERQINYHIDTEKGPKFGRLNHNDIELQRSIPSTDEIGKLLQLPSSLHYTHTMVMTAMELLPVGETVRHKMHNDDTLKETQKETKITVAATEPTTSTEESKRVIESNTSKKKEETKITVAATEKQQHLQKKKDNVTKDHHHLQKEKNEFTENKLNPKESDLESEEAKITVRADLSDLELKETKREPESIKEPPWKLPLFTTRASEPPWKPPSFTTRVSVHTRRKADEIKT